MRNGWPKSHKFFASGQFDSPVFFLRQLPSQRMVEGYADRFDSVDPAKVLGALQLMRDGSLLIRELEAYFARHDLSQLRFLTLILIDREPDRDYLAASEISDRLDVSRPVVARTLKTLEKAGLISISRVLSVRVTTGRDTSSLSDISLAAR